MPPTQSVVLFIFSLKELKRKTSGALRAQKMSIHDQSEVKHEPSTDAVGGIPICTLSCRGGTDPFHATRYSLNLKT
jgi:hypothetical protein